MAVPSIVKSLSELSLEEARTISDLQASLSQDDSTVRKFGTHDWLKLAWCRSLDPNKAVDVLSSHKEYIHKWNLNEIPIDQVRENFKAGFSVLAGRDFDGRPMLWQRMQFMTPATIPLDVGIKSTWLALDAALADLDSNRVGVCLIYDFADVGVRNMTLNLLDVRDGSLACGAGHPSHITKVIFLNPPFVFRMAFNAARPLLPLSVSSVVQMMDAGEEDWYRNLCPRTQLPEYLGGEQTGDYFSWLATRLEGSNLLYHPDPIAPPTRATISEVPQSTLIGQ